MKRSTKWLGLLMCAAAVALAAYCEYRASFANLHVLLAEQEDLRLFPELGKEIGICLNVLMGTVLVLAASTAFLLVKKGKDEALK